MQRRNWDSSVSTVSGYRLDDYPSSPNSVRRSFTSPLCPHWLWDPPSLLSKDVRGSSWGVKCMRHESDHSPPSRAKVKNAWSYTCSFLYVFMAWCLIRLYLLFFTFTLANLDIFWPAGCCDNHTETLIYWKFQGIERNIYENYMSK